MLLKFIFWINEDFRKELLFSFSLKSLLLILFLKFGLSESEFIKFSKSIINSFSVSRVSPSIFFNKLDVKNPFSKISIPL